MWSCKRCLEGHSVPLVTVTAAAFSALPALDDYKPQLLLRPDVRPKDMKNLQIYKAGYDILLELHRFAANMPREHKFTIGERIKNEAISHFIARLPKTTIRFHHASVS